MPPAFRIMQVPVYLPPSAGLGIALISYFALPTAQDLGGSTASTPTLILISSLHAIALYLVILVHEIGHVVAARHYQYPVEKVVIHVIGGHTAFKNRFNQPRHQFVVAVAGPIFTLALGALGWGIGALASSPLLDSLAAWLLWGSVIGGLLNLLPGFPLDGGAAISALVWYRTRKPLMGQKVSAYGGFFVSALWITFPLVLGFLFNFQPTLSDFLLPWFLGIWMSFNAWAQLQALNNQDVTPEVSTKPWHLNARKCIPVSPDTSCEQLQAQLLEAKAETAIVVEGAEIRGVVDRNLLRALSANELAEKTSLQIARKTFPSDFISRYISKVEYIELVKSQFTNEWIVLDAAGRIYGVAYRDEQEINEPI